MLRLIRTSKLDGKLMDVGCAYGLLANFASEHFETYGIDVSRFAVEKSKIYCRGNIAKASAVDIPFRGETFDVITVLDTLEHVPSLTQCLEDIYRGAEEEWCTPPSTTKHSDLALMQTHGAKPRNTHERLRTSRVESRPIESLVQGGESLWNCYLRS